MKSQKKLPIIVMTLVIALSLMVGGITSASDLEQRATFEAPLLVVNTSFLNVRTGPGVQYSVLVTVVGGTELPAIGVANDGVWHQVATDAGPGWVNINFTLPRGVFDNVPIVEVGEVGAANVLFGQPATTTSTGTTVVTDAGATRVAFDITNVSNRIGITGINAIGRDMHKEPSYDSPIINRSVPNDPNTIYPLLDSRTDSRGNVWYRANIPGKGDGWMDAVMFRLLECGQDQVGVVISETPIAFDGFDYTREPFLLTVGTETYILGRDGDFAIIQLMDGTAGLAQAHAIANRSPSVVSACSQVPNLATNTGAPLVTVGGTVATDGSDSTTGTRFTIPQLATNHVVVNTAFLNIRSGPSAGFSVIATVPGGTELAVLGRATDNVWLLVQGDFGAGWINNEFTLFRGTYDTVPVLREPVIISSAGVPVTSGVSSTSVAVAGHPGTVAVTGPTQQGFDLTNISNRLAITGVSLIGRDMHKEPSYDSPIISRSVPNDPNTIYPLLDSRTDSRGNIWYRVNVPGKGDGWMDAVTFRLLECGIDNVNVVISETPISFDGFMHGRDTFLLTVGTEVYIIGRQGDFAIIQLMDGTAGLAQAGALTKRSPEVVSACSQVPSLVTATGTPVINVPTASHPSIVSGTVVDTTATSPIPRITGNHVVVNTGNLNIRSGPAAGFGSIAVVPGGTELAVLGIATDGVWYFVEGRFGRGWLNNEFVLFRGDPNTVPILDLGG